MNNRRIWLWLIPLLLVTTWLGARSLDADAFWHDEVWTLWDVGGGHFDPRSPIDVWNGMAERKVDNLPGYYLILNTWGKLTGWSEFSTRVLSLFFGLLAVSWTYRLGRDLLNPRVGFAAAVILGTSAFFVNYLHELRGYTMTAALTAFTLWAYIRLMGLESRRGASRSAPTTLLQVGFVAGVAGLMYAHYFATLGVIALGAYHVLLAANKFTRHWWHVLGLMAIGGLMFVPWLFSGAIGGALNRIDNDERLHSLSMNAPEATERVLYYFGNGSYLLLIMAAVGVALAMWKWRQARLIGFMALAILALGLLVNVKMELLEKGRIRYLIGLWPLLSLLAAIGLVYLINKISVNLASWRFNPNWLLSSLLGIWVIAGVVNVFNPAFVRDLDGSQQENDWKALFDVLDTQVQAGDAVAFDAPIFTWVPYRVFTYYAETLPARWTLMDSLPGEQEDDEYFEQAQTFIDSANETNGGNGAMRVWLGADTREESSFRLGEFERALETDNYATCGPIIDSDDMTLDLYAVVPECCFPPENIAAAPYRYSAGSAGDGIAITHVEPLPPNTSQSLPVLLAWSVDDALPDNTYSVALHVLNANDELVAQADYGLPVESFTCRAVNIPLENLPPGDYTLTSIVYDWQTGARLSGQAIADSIPSERLPLSTFTVAP